VDVHLHYFGLRSVFFFLHRFFFSGETALPLNVESDLSQQVFLLLAKLFKLSFFFPLRSYIRPDAPFFWALDIIYVLFLMSVSLYGFGAIMILENASQRIWLSSPRFNGGLPSPGFFLPSQGNILPFSPWTLIRPPASLSRRSRFCSPRGTEFGLSAFFSFRPGTILLFLPDDVAALPFVRLFFKNKSGILSFP